MMDSKPRLTILVLAYSISPVRGSEYAVGWNYVRHMSRDHDLVVLYGLAGNHMGDVEEMSAVPTDAFGGHVTFVPVLPDRRARIANHLNRTGHVPLSFYAAYRYWHLGAFAAAQRIVAERQIDVVHYLCPIGFREPGYLWKLDKPYIWGPIGGIAARPVRAFGGLGVGERVRTIVRNAVNEVQFRASRVRKGILKADVLLAATSENAHAIERVYGRRAIVVPENAIDAGLGTMIDQAMPHPKTTSHDPLRLVWIGTLETRKAITILLRALARLDAPTRWTLDVIGDGPLMSRSQEEAVALGVDGPICWHGKVPRDKAVALLEQADLHVLTSLAEANTTVLWEAMGASVPTMAIDHCGMHDSICNACGIRIPLDSIEAMSASFATAIGRLIDDRSALARLSNGTRGCAIDHGWERRIAFWREMYNHAIAAHGTLR
jgi:glycosyltransferase involved in cell wall biosynthesis